MADGSESYQKHVEALEVGLARYSKRSFESFSQEFVGGGAIHEFYEAQWRNTQSSSRLKLLNRTPLQLERDRILYSSPIRKQTEKYHVLYNGQRRIVRNYTTHTMRMAQVTRSICRGLALNADFAEAIALGSKAGAAPFIHASKGPIAQWVRDKVNEIDKEFVAQERAPQPKERQWSLEFGDASVPAWISRLQSSQAIEKVRQFIPWAAGTDVNNPYSAGQQSYWMLCTNPYAVEPNPSLYCPETMVGIWRHTRGTKPAKDSFHHKFQALNGALELKWNQFTYEASVVQYADDITWIIENLNDANTAALLNNHQSVYDRLLSALGEIPDALVTALSRNDSGGIYTYFIVDFVDHSASVLRRIGDDSATFRAGLRNGSSDSYIGLSAEAEDQLGRCAKFLNEEVFKEPRVQNRANMLKTVSVACLDLLYRDWEDTLPRLIREKSTIERWSPDRTERALQLIRDRFHRIQVAVDVFAEMGDQEIYDFVGIQSL